MLKPSSGPPRPAIASGNWRAPWVQLKTFSFHPCVYPAMIRGASPGAKAGDLVNVYDREGQPFGVGLYNPRANVPLRMIYHGPDEVGEDLFLTLIDRALDLRLNDLRLPERGDAFRVIHSDGDGLGGLIVDKFGDVLSVQMHSLGMFQRFPQWLPRLHERLGTRRMVLEVDPAIARLEGISARTLPVDAVRTIRIREHGVRYEVDLETGHKTGFFCDQRDNRRRLTEWVKDKRVLDLCCYTGGFSLSAKVTGGAADVTGVDLDEQAIAQAKRNANLNQARVNWVHCDAYSYARQVQKNGELWDVVVLDPPKLLHDREEFRDAERHYEDLNKLGMLLLKPGGLLVTCSCSGLLSAEEFETIVARGANRVNRRLQILDRTGAGLDHPQMANCPESRYLKVLWARVL